MRNEVEFVEQEIVLEAEEEIILEAEHNIDILETENNFDALLPQYEHYYSDESDDSSDDANIVFNKALAAWFVESNVSNALANKLLALLSEKIEGLPKDIRTLKRTPTDAPTVSLAGGEYAHYGLRDCLTDFLRQYKVHTTILDLNFNIDGLPIAKSSQKSVWPILVNLNTTDSVFVVGIYCGRSHPNDVNNFLAQFVDEFNDLLQNGFSYENKTFEIKCRAFILDAPARALVLGVKGHTGYSCCTKCIQRGEWKDHRMIFHYQNHPLRTNLNFRQRNDVSHHNQQSTLEIEKLPIDMIQVFALDYMHVVCLGVMKALLGSWIKVKNRNYSLQQNNIRKLKADVRVYAISGAKLLRYMTL